MTALPAADLSDLHNDRRTYVLEPLKILYVSAPKNACTSLKWLIAELAGEDLSRFQPGLTWLLNTDDAIHRRSLFQHAPRVTDLTPDERAKIHPDAGWFVFSVVRDPRARLFSAWENKFLLRTPDYHRYAAQDWYPGVPENADDIARDFATFVEVLHGNPEHNLTRDAHFAKQTRLIRPDLFPYSKIYDVSDMKTLLGDLAAHLAAQGVERSLTLRRANDTPLRANKHVFAEPVRSRIEEMYAVDFENFGDHWDFGKIEAADDWSAASLQDVRGRIAVHERLTEVLVTARRAKRRAQRAERRLAKTGRKPAPGKAQRKAPGKAPAKAQAGRSPGKPRGGA